MSTVIKKAMQASELTIKTIDVSIQCVRIGNKAMTLAVFNQITLANPFHLVGYTRWEQPNVEQVEVVPDGLILGWVAREGQWVLWTQDGLLYKAMLRRGFEECFPKREWMEEREPRFVCPAPTPDDKLGFAARRKWEQEVYAPWQQRRVIVGESMNVWEELKYKWNHGPCSQLCAQFQAEHNQLFIAV